MNGALTVHNQAQGINFFAIDHNVKLNQIRRLELFEMVVQRSITARSRFKFVEEIHYDFVHWQIISQHDLTAHVLHIDLNAALLVTQSHDVTDIFLRHEDGRSDNRLKNGFDSTDFRQFGRVFNFDFLAVFQHDFINHRWRSGNQVHVELAFQTFLNDFQVQQTQESATEAEAQRLGNLRLKFQRSIVQLQFFQSIAQGFVVVAFHGIKACKYLALYFLKAGQRLRSRVGNQSNRIADFRLSQFFHAGNQKAHFAGFEFLFLNRFRCEYAQLLNLSFRLGAHKAYFVFQLDGAVFHTNQHNYADVVVKP